MKEIVERLIDGERRMRREFCVAFKTLVPQQTREPSTSVAGVALSYGLHPNMGYRWLREQRLSRQQGPAQTPPFIVLPVAAVVADDHVAVPAAITPIQASGDGRLIRMEVQRASAIVKIE